MSKGTVISVEAISKMYDLGLVGTGTLSRDINRAWARVRGKPDPYAKLAELNDRSIATKTGSVWALREVSFQVQEGEVIGIIGKNGAGKSTLLKILSQITAPSSGSIKIKGRVASLLEVGTGMHPEMTARQNIYLNGSIMGMRRSEITRKLDEIVDFAGIGKYLDTPTKRFSSGMQVRLGFAVAAFLDPEILIVDEVLAVGDAEFQKKAIGKMQDVSRGEGRTVLFVSHDMNSIKSLCGKVVVLENGGVSMIESAPVAIDQYLNQGRRDNNRVVFSDLPGDNWYRLHSIRLTNKDGIDIAYLNINNTHILEMDVEILKLGMNGIPNIHFKTVKGEYAFNVACELKELSLKLGRFLITCEIPPHLLNAVQYTLDVGLTTMAPFKIHFLEKEVLTVNAIENMQDRVEGHNQKIDGVVRPRFCWTVQKI